MNTVNITIPNAIKAWNNANPQNKKFLEDLLGEDTLKPKDIRERINSWEDILCLSNSSASDFELRPGETDDELAYRQGKLIALTYNAGKICSLKERRYYPWGELVEDNSKPSGFALSCDDCDSWVTSSTVGVRLCFSNSDHATDAFKKFTAIYERLQIF